MSSKQWHWILFTVATCFGVGFLTQQMLWAEDKSLYLIGETTAAHHQIELACNACHASEFGGKEVLQDACIGCHAEELKVANDSHPLKKFIDPRNADRVEILDARYCLTCHVEHEPERTGPMAVTLPEDYCFKCHEDVGENRPTHKGMGFETCASAGCHNYHDNRALYEDFLVKHGHDKDIKAQPSTLTKSDEDILRQVVKGFADPIAKDGADNQSALRAKAKVAVNEWHESAHADSGVNCGACHNDQAGQWVEQPGYAICSDCHSGEAESFKQGRHGMRLAQGMSPMKPEMAVIPMKGEAHGTELTCGTCHKPHEQDTKFAAVEACVGCHADEHTQNFADSKHAALWQQEMVGEIPHGQGVSCATCHMPRSTHNKNGVSVNVVNHNQNDNLRPNEKMIRGVCMNCHGLGFSIDALADPKLIKNNFIGLPAEHIESIDMALEREGK